MIDKLREIANHFDQLQQELSDPEVYADPDRMRRLNREVHELTPLVETYREYARYADNLAQAEEMLSDPEMKEMAQEEMADAMDDIRDSDLDPKEDILAAYEQSLEFSLLLLENTSSYTITYTIDQDGYLTETKIEHHYQTDDQDTYLIHTTSLTDYPLDKPESLIPQIEG